MDGTSGKGGVGRQSVYGVGRWYTGTHMHAGEKWQQPAGVLTLSIKYECSLVVATARKRPFLTRITPTYMMASFVVLRSSWTTSAPATASAPATSDIARLVRTQEGRVVRKGGGGSCGADEQTVVHGLVACDMAAGEAYLLVLRRLCSWLPSASRPAPVMLAGGGLSTAGPGLLLAAVSVMIGAASEPSLTASLSTATATASSGGVVTLLVYTRIGSVAWWRPVVGGGRLRGRLRGECLSGVDVEGRGCERCVG
jgi:hypothetical protein